MVWAFLSRRLRKWLLLSVLVPTAASALGAVGDEIERRRGESNKVTRALQTGRDRFGRGARSRRRGV